MRRHADYRSGRGARGLMSEFGTSTLANFVAEFARLEGVRMLNVMFIACSLTSDDDWRAPRNYPRPCSPRERAWLRAFAPTATGPLTLYDMRELRGPLRDGKIDAGWELREVIAGFLAATPLNLSHRTRSGVGARRYDCRRTPTAWTSPTSNSACSNRPFVRAAVPMGVDHGREKFEYQFHSHVRPASTENARL